VNEPDPPPPISSAEAAPPAAVAVAPPYAEVPFPVMPEVAFQKALLALTPKVYVAHALIAVNALIFVAMVMSGVGLMSPASESLISWGANYGPRTTGGEWWRLFTCMFLHAGIIHVGMNMLVLHNIGPFVERLTGNAGFLILYVFAGLAGSVLSIAWQPYVLSVGASGAVFGMYGALIGFLVRRRGSIPREVLADLQKSAIAFLGYNLIFGLTQKGIDMAAHLGGVIGGFAGGYWLSHPLDASGASGRLRRNALLAVVGLALIAGLTQVLPHGTDVQAVLKRFDVTEARLIDLVNDKVQKVQEGVFTGPELATTLETQVLPEWHAARIELEGMKRVPPESAKVVTQLATYMKLREEGWTLMAQGLRADDLPTMEKAKAKQAEAEAMIKQIGK
jgi:rhomboid protease GluP